MGLEKNKKHEENAKRGGRGSVNNGNRLDAFANGHGGGGADWGGVDPTKLQSVVVHITELGGAVTFGLSRDKGAHMLALMLDGKRETLWFNKDDDLDEKIDMVEATLASMS